MLDKIPKFFNYLILPIFIILFFFIFNNTLFNKNSQVLLVSNDNFSELFISSLPDNTKILKKYLSKLDFIESFFLKLNNEKLLVEINMYNAFAKNNINEQIIFENGSISKFIYFKDFFIKNIQIENSNNKTSKLNLLSIKNLKKLNYIHDIIKIEKIDNRRLDIFLRDGRKIMLPKTINSNLIDFLNESLNSFMMDVNFKSYLDLRNFDSNSIRMK